jgi:hypothetical protein
MFDVGCWLLDVRENQILFAKTGAGTSLAAWRPDYVTTASEPRSATVTGGAIPLPFRAELASKVYYSWPLL